jgi:uncharacterized protein (UPF0303 family)
MADLLPELDRFGPDEAWRMGTALVERRRAEGLAVTVTVRLGEQRAFHYQRCRWRTSRQDRSSALSRECWRGRRRGTVRCHHR